MKPETVIKNSDVLKEIMAREMKLASEKGSSKAIYRASVNLTNNLTVEAKAQFQLLHGRAHEFWGC